MLAFTQRVITVRKQHPQLRQPRFLHGDQNTGRGLPDVSWFRPDGTPMEAADWEQGATLGMLLDGIPDRVESRHANCPLLMLINGGDRAVDWRLPVTGGRWLCVLHTDTAHCHDPASARAVNAEVSLPAHSVAVYRLHAEVAA